LEADKTCLDQKRGEEAISFVVIARFFSYINIHGHITEFDHNNNGSFTFFPPRVCSKNVIFWLSEESVKLLS
jgi:hypothetical protein